MFEIYETELAERKLSIETGKIASSEMEIYEDIKVKDELHDGE